MKANEKIGSSGVLVSDNVEKRFETYIYIYIYIYIYMTNLTHNYFFSYMFIPNLYMFRELMCLSSGELIVPIRHLVYVTVCR